MMDNFEKFTRLFLLIVLSFLIFIGSSTGIFFSLKFISASMIEIPGFDKMYGLLITATPYLIFLAAFLFIFKKIRSSKKSGGKIWAIIIALLGCLVCFTGLTFKCILYFGIDNEWLRLFEYNSHYFLMAQLFLVMFSTMALALGGEKEKDWIEK